MLLKQNKIKNKHLVNNYLKLNFGPQYAYFYNILRFLLPLKNENILKISLYNKLFEKFALLIVPMKNIEKKLTGQEDKIFLQKSSTVSHPIWSFENAELYNPFFDVHWEFWPDLFPDMQLSVYNKDWKGLNELYSRHIATINKQFQPLQLDIKSKTKLLKYRNQLWDYPQVESDCLPFDTRYPTSIDYQYFPKYPGVDYLDLWSEEMNPFVDKKRLAELDLKLQDADHAAVIKDLFHPYSLNLPNNFHPKTKNLDWLSLSQPFGNLRDVREHTCLYNFTGDILNPVLGTKWPEFTSYLKPIIYSFNNNQMLNESMINFFKAVLNITICFPEFFLFPVGILTWIFTKFSFIDKDLKELNIGYASFFNKNLKISNIHTLLSSTTNYIKNNLFMILIFIIIPFFLFLSLDNSYQPRFHINLFSNSLISNNYTVCIKFFLLFLFFGIFLVNDTVFSTKITTQTYNILLMFSILPALLLLISLNNFLFFYVALEFISLLTYILLFLTKTTNAFEAGVKYFTSGGLISGAFILFGTLNLWNIFGSVDIIDIAIILGCQKQMTSFMIFSFIFIIIGLLFKLAAFPMQQWAPSVYMGIRYSQLSFIMVVFKFILLAVFLRFYITLQPAFFFFISPVIYGIAVGSMCIGLIGIARSVHNLSIKKFIAYSSITHIGYLFAIIADTTNEDILWLGLYYSMLYSISILLFLIILSRFLIINKAAIGFSFKEIETFVDLQKFYNSLRYTDTIYNFYKIEFFLLLISVWSMAGLPPLPGFFGKISILFNLFNSIQWWVNTNWEVMGGMPRHLLDQVFLKEYFINQAIYFFLLLIFCVTITSILMIWYYFKFFKYLFIEIPEEDSNDFYDTAISHTYWVGGIWVNIQTWCQLKVPVFIWNWFLIFYTFCLVLVTVGFSWYGLFVNLGGTTYTFNQIPLFPLRSTSEWSIFDTFLDYGEYNNDHRSRYYRTVGDSAESERWLGLLKY